VILVLGGLGQLGTELSVRAGEAGVPLAAVGHAEVDVADPKTIARAIAKYRPTLIVNAAAYNNVDRAENQIAQAERTNALGASVVAASAKRAGLPLIHISTDYVFDGEKGTAYVESDPVSPLSAYGRSKEKGEEGIRNSHPQHLILRTSWLYGVYGTNFLKTVVRLAAEQDTLGFVAAQRGTPTSTADLAKAILIAAEAIGKGTAAWGTYHVAGQGTTSRHGMASAIVAAQARFTQRKPPIATIAVPENTARRPANSSLDSSKFAAAFGYAPGDWKEAVKHTVNLLFAKQGRI
jgi:dTDP-4-dehydrorhamnose reductase